MELFADRPLHLPVEGAHRPADAARDRQQQAHGVLGEVHADETLGAGEDYAAAGELGVEGAVDAGGRALHPAQVRRLGEEIGADTAEDHLDFGDHLLDAAGVGRHDHLEVVGHGAHLVEEGAVDVDEIGVHEEFHGCLAGFVKWNPNRRRSDPTSPGASNGEIKRARRAGCKNGDANRPGELAETSVDS